MGKNDGSVAPKERVNIVYKSDTGDAKEEVELPFRMMIMGDFTGRADDTVLEEREPVSVDKDNFNDVLAAQNVTVDAQVPNELSDKEGEELSVSLNFKQMKDFSPDAICQQIPELKQLTELRDALTALKGPLGNIPAFRKRLQAILDDPEAQQRLVSELKLDSKDEG